MAANYSSPKGSSQKQLVELQSVDVSRDPSVVNVLQSVDTGDEATDASNQNDQKANESNDENTLGLSTIEYDNHLSSLSQSSINRLQGSPYDVKAIRERNAARQNRQFQWNPRVMSKRDSTKDYNNQVPFFVCH